jgi:nucleoside-diphosphate-sugar epimerase
MSRSVKGSNVSVIGGAGFLGSHLVNTLVEEYGCNVLVIDNLVSGRRDFVHPKAKFIHADITESEEHLKNIFQQGKIQFAFNYAASPYIPDSFVRPLHVFNTTCFGAMKVINAAQSAGCEAILQVSSAEIYGDNGHIADVWQSPPLSTDRGKINELSVIRPHSTYGVAKAAVDNFVQVRWREAQTPCIALRQFNCIGERETHPYIVPEIISQLSSQDPDACGYRSDGTKEVNDCYLKLGNNSFRDFLYASDAVRMAVELIERGSFGEVYNLGSETGIKIYDLAKVISRIMGFGDVWIDKDPTRVRPWEIWHLQSDNSKIYSVIESRPRVSLEEALKLTIKYYKSNKNKWCWE